MTLGRRIDLTADVDAVAPGVVELRRDLHRYPELAFEEDPGSWEAVDGA